MTFDIFLDSVVLKDKKVIPVWAVIFQELPVMHFVASASSTLL